MREKFARFMSGRYGVDTLSRHISVLVLILIIGNLFMPNMRVRMFITLINYVLMAVILLRMFSKNIYKRYAENQAYEARLSPMRKFFSLQKRKRADKEHKYYHCPSCHQLVRVPRGRGKIEITCPKCHTRFEKRT